MTCKMTCKLLILLFLPASLFAQTKSGQKMAPTGKPVIIYTQKGQKSIQPQFPFQGKILQRKQHRTITPKNKGVKTQLAPKVDYRKEMRKVELKAPAGASLRGVKATREIPVYHKATMSEKRQTKRAWDYESITLTNQADIANFNSLYPGCTSVGALMIDGAGINNLSTLSALTSAGMIAVKNTALTNLAALTSLTSIADSLVLENNSSLTGIGLTNVATLGGLVLRDLPALTTVDAFNSGLTAIANDVIITNTAVASLAGLSAVVNIGGYLKIIKSAVASPNLTALRTVGYIWFDDNSQMTDPGLESITQMAGLLLNKLPLVTSLGLSDNGLSNRNIATLWLGEMPLLTDIDYAQQFTSVANLILINCDGITNLNAFQNIISAQYGIFIYNNDGLQSISGLSQITSVASDKIEISFNSNLSSLNGLQNITETDALWINYNNSLTSLSNLNPALLINNVNGDDLQITGNGQLSVCDVPAICNYLNSGNAVNPQISGNAGNCIDLATVNQNCGTTSICPTKNIITWNGSASDDWDDPQNWTPNQVPDECSVVIINSGNDNDPNPYRDITIGGLKMNSGYLYLNGYNLTVADTFIVYNSYIEGVADLKVLKAISPKISFTYFESYSLEITNFTGEASIYQNTFYGDVTISDHTSRAGNSYTFGNEFFSDLTFTNNSDYGANYLSNGVGVSDYIYGNLTINNNSTANISIGIGSDEPLHVENTVTINQAYLNNIFLDKITFGGTNFQQLIVPQIIGVGITGLQKGTIEYIFEIKNLFFRKDGGFLFPEQDIMVTNQLVMGASEGIFGSQSGKMLIIGPAATVLDEDPLNGSFVEGPMKKIGNAAFTFPLGKTVGIPNLTGKQSNKDNSFTKRDLYGDFKAPLSISAPAESTAEFVAEYKRSNLLSDGYDPNQHEPGVDGIIGDEYWILNHLRGASDVSVTLTYDKNRVEVPFAGSQLNITGWNGTQWISHLKGATTGDNDRGTVSTASPITTYGPLALFAQSIRTPILTIQPLADTLICKGSSFKVHFTLDTAALEGTTFTIEMSDENGDFGTPLTVANKTTFVSDSIPVNIPASWLTTGNHYLLRMKGDRQAILSQNTIGFKVVDKPQVNISIIGPAEVCMNTGAAKYYFSEKEAGVTYNWNVAGGTFTVDNDTAYITFTATGNRMVQVIPVNKCGNGQEASQSVLVKAGTPVTAPVLTNVGRWIYVSTPPPAEQVTSYKWYKDGVLMAGQTGNNYYASVAGTFTVEFGNDCGSSPLSNTISFANASVPQTITFDALPNRVYGDDPFAFPATSSSGLPVSYLIVSGPGNITDGIFTITKSGTVTIKAFQQGDNVYDTAVPVGRSFVISKAMQAIEWDSMPDYDYKGSNIYVTLPRYSSGGLPVAYQSSSPNITLSGFQLQIKGVGNVSITATQPGDTNYLPADAVVRNFCVRVAELNTITGAEYVCPGQEAIYRINKVAGLTYHWQLSDGTVLGSDADTVKVNWLTTGSYKLYVFATNPCGPVTATDSLSVTVMDGVTAPDAVQNMLPLNGVIDQKLPLLLSWIPGNHTLSYDIFIWEDGTPKPAAPFVSNHTKISYTIAKNAGLLYDKVYNWQVVSKNGCLQTAGPVQTFRLRKATDLAVTNVTAPLSVNSGQRITINWTVKNVGAGNTLTNEKWPDAVFLSFDTIPTLLSPTLSGIGWSVLDFPVKPLLIGTKQNVASLNAGEEYTNSIDFDVPLSYSQPLYVYVITNYKGDADAPPQSDFTNDTARQQEPINVILTPTPDLRVDTLLIPATTFSGSKINVTYKVKNYGALTPSGSKWNDKIYISKSPLFVKKNAIQLEFPNQNEMYYPADKATISNHTVLQPDSSLTRSVEVIIPNFISGTWFIHVITNEDKVLYEGALAENNEGNKSINILLTPTPQFTISSLNVPVTNMSTTQTVGINWNVLNAGFYDNIEKNKGFYGGTRGLCSGGRYGNQQASGPLNVSGRGGSTGTETVVLVPKEFDSLSWGSSYWVDKIYLSADPSGLNTGTALYLGQATKGIENLGWQMPLDVKQNFEHCGDVHHPIPGGTTNNVLRPGSSHPNQFNFKVPADLPEGNYYFYVQSNSTKSVFTYIDTPVVRRSGMITISRPDLVVSSFSVPTLITGGTPFNFEYTVANNGPGSVYDANRTDSIFMSNSPVFDASATFVKAVTFTENIAVGTPVSHTVEHTLPNDISGTKYFFVKTNAGKAFIENSFNNNVGAAAMANTATALPVDLAVSNVIVADTSLVPGAITINYTVQNNGANTALGETIDSIYISCSPVFDKATAMPVGTRKNVRNIAAGGSVQDSVQFSIKKQAYLLNTCFAKADFSKVYFYVKANSGRTIYESGDTSNNVGTSGEKTFANKNVDFEISNLNAPDTAIVGRPYALVWNLKNIGLYQSHYYWTVRVIFSADSSNLDNAVTSDFYSRSTTLNPNETKVRGYSEAVPKMPTGDYYITVITDADENFTNEVHIGNNRQLLRDENGKAKKIHVVLPLLSDLVSEIVSAPTSIAVGQPLTVKYKVTNSGDGITYPNAWSDDIWLATGSKPFYGDLRMANPYHNGNLAPGDYYDDSIKVTIPLNTVPGNYMLIASADKSNYVIEKNDTNNLGLKPILVYVPEPVDLAIPEVTAPDTVYLGYPVDSVRWRVNNISANTAQGVSTDGIYLSKKPTFDSSAILIGLKNKTLNMSALASDTLAFAPVISNVPEGNYYIIVKTDLLNNISETDKTNNEGVTAQQVYVSVKELKLDITLPDTMSVPKFYKLQIPDSLLGSTILLTLKSEDSLTQRNEMHVGGGYIPSVIQSDYKFNTPNYGNQQILISDITQPVYYIAVRPVSNVITKQNITLHATRLPFAILMTQTNRGGNGGNVTVKLTGSLFTDSMTAKLSNGGATINATKVYFINSTVVYATFPLQGKPIGVYDVVLTKTDLSEAVLDDGFSVVSPDNGGLYATGMNTGPNGPGTQPGCDPGAPAGLNSQLVVELVVPDKVFAGWPFVVQVNYSNPTNMDIPVQTKVLYNDYNVPMAFKKEELTGGNTNALFIEISETDGPPGVIRAGSSGSITIYSTTPQNAEAHDKIKFHLK